MRNISAAFLDASLSTSTEPVFVAKIINATNTIYVTTANITINDAGSIQLQGVIEQGGASFSSQSIKPEAGISTIGGATIKIIDRAREFTDELNSINTADDSLFNDRVELYYGYKNIDFADYVLWMPLYVESFNNDELTYTLKLSDTQRISKKSLFADLNVTELVGNYGYQDTTTIECISPAGFPLVEHDAEWAEDPNQTIGYLKVFGVAQDGREVKEVISYTGTNATQFTGVRRGRFGTQRVNLSATVDGNAVTVELMEMVYLDLVQPKMLIALLTGDLYGQVGQSIPAAWSAGLSSSLINLTSIENIGGDLWQEHIEFRDLEDDDAKGFITEQVLVPYGVFMRIDQQGEYELTRYDFLSQQSPALTTLSYDKLISVSPPNRSVKDIVNYFRINWEWRVDDVDGYYARNDYYIDANSQSKYDFESPLKDINLRGLRNRDKTSKPSLDFVAQSQVKRLANPQITRTAKTYLRHVIDLEVGDTIALELLNEPDYRTGGTYLETFEIQSMTVDFFAGTVSMSLFASEGTPSEFIVSNGSNVVDIDVSGWTNLDGSGYGVNDAGTFKFNNGADIPSGKYRFDGDVELPDTYTITINGSFYLDCASFHQGASTKIDGDGRGVLNDTGYFGGGDTSQSGITQVKAGFLNGATDLYLNNGNVDYTNGRIWVDLPSVQRVEASQSIDGLIPSKLYGSSGGKGGDNVMESSYTGSLAGGAAVSGGAGFFVSCDSFTYESSAEISLNGSNNNVGGITEQTTSNDWFHHAGSSGFGWPGVCIVALKDRGAAKPFLYDLVVAKSGTWSESGSVTNDNKRVNGGSTDKKRAKGQDNDYYPSSVGGVSFANKDFAAESNRSAIHVMNLVVADDAVPELGVDSTGAADAVTINATELLNTPRTPLGNQSTIEVTATPAVGDTDFRYVLFEYRLKDQDQWVPIAYDVRTEATFTVQSSGDTYEIRATAYNAANKAGGVTIQEITVANVERDSDTSDGAEEDAPIDITLPKIRGLELVNRIDNGDNWNQWKSPNAEFRWLKMSNTLPAGLDNLNGSTDLHLEGYKVRISRPTGEILREEVVKDSFYSYTFDKNKKDTNGDPVRSFLCEVQAVSTTGFVSDFVGINVTNPAPAAPTGITTEIGYNSFNVKFELPTDVDFIGVDFYIVQGTGDPFLVSPTRISGNTVTVEDLDQGTEHRYGLTSVDQFGAGSSSSSIAVITNQLEAIDVDGLGPWATETDPVDLAFIGANMDNDSIASDKVVSLTAAKITAGQVTVQVDLGTGIILDGASGVIQSSNAGYEVTLGPHIDAAVDPVNPLVFSANDGVNYNYWFNSNGDFSLGNGGFTYDAGLDVSSFTGQITITAGSGIGNLTDSGALATEDTADFATHVSGAAKPSDNADVTEIALNAGTTTMGAGSILLSGTNANIAVGASSTWKTTGIQLQYNSGSPRAFLGDDTTDKSLTYDSDGLRIGLNSSIAGVDAYNAGGYLYYSIPAYLIPVVFSVNSYATATRTTFGDTQVAFTNTTNTGSVSLLTNGGSTLDDFKPRDGFRAKFKLAAYLADRYIFDATYRLDSGGTNGYYVVFRPGSASDKVSVYFGRKVNSIYSETLVGTGVAASTTPGSSLIYHEFEIIQDRAGSCKFYMDGTLYWTDTRVIPSPGANMRDLVYITGRAAVAGTSYLMVGDFKLSEIGY